jgi:hypothetical protein
MSLLDARRSDGINESRLSPAFALNLELSAGHCHWFTRGEGASSTIGVPEPSFRTPWHCCYSFAAARPLAQLFDFGRS